MMNWRVRNPKTDLYLQPESRDGIPVWGDYSTAERFRRKDAIEVALAFGAVPEGGLR